MAGFRALSVEGVVGLRAENLARSLNVSKGSFYWHFKDLNDFKAKMLAHWREQAFGEATQDDEKAHTPTARLMRLANASGAAPDDLGGTMAEPAIRDWARSDTAVRQTVEEVDKKRLAYIEGILEDLGQPDPQAAAIFYAAFIGFSQFSALRYTSDAHPDGQNAALERLASLLVRERGTSEPILKPLAGRRKRIVRKLR